MRHHRRVRSRKAARARARSSRARRALAWAALVAVTVLGWTAGVGGAATSPSVVSATVPSATSIDASGCLPGVAGRTDFGLVLPGAAHVTTDDCTVVFGSSNDTSMLRLARSNAFGTAMLREHDGTVGWDVTGDHPPVAGENETWRGMDLLPGGGVLVSATASESGNNEAAILRLDADGVADPSWDGDGWSTFARDTWTSDEAHAVLQHSGGRVILATQANLAPERRLYAFDATGSVDLAWGASGSADITGPTSSRVVQLLELADGSILVLSREYHAGPPIHWTTFVHRFTSGGALDTTFSAGDGSDGYVELSRGATWVDDYTYGALELPDGDLLLSGWTDNNPTGIQAHTILRLDADGAIDTAWASGGYVFLTHGGSHSYGRGLALLDDGSILAAAAENDGANDLSVAKLTPAGALDTSWGAGDGDGVDGIATLDAGGTDDSLKGIVAMPDGGALLAGSTNSGVDRDSILVRLAPTGAPDPDFDGDGILDVGMAGDDELLGIRLLGSAAVASGTVDQGTHDDLRIVSLQGEGVSDYEDLGGAGDTDWAGAAASNMFGACLHGVTAATADWTSSGSCTASDADPWNAIPAMIGDASAKVAHAASGTTTASAQLRFGFRAAGSQRAGTYAAHVDFEVVAPDA